MRKGSLVIVLVIYKCWLGGFLVDYTIWYKVLIGGIYIVEIFLQWKKLMSRNYFHSLFLQFYSEQYIIRYLFNVGTYLIHVSIQYPY